MERTLPGDTPQTYDPQAFSRDEPKTVFLLTSLSSGSSSIVTATSRLEHILKSSKIPFKAVDLATDEKARRLWQWKAKGKRLPGIAKDGEVLGNFEDVEDWNEHGELRQALGVSKKKKKTGMSGTTRSPNPSKTATPNIVQPREPVSTDPVGGIPTVFAQAALASAAAAAGKNMKKTGTTGLKAAVGKVEGKMESVQEAAVEPKSDSIAKKDGPAAAKNADGAEAKDEPAVTVAKGDDVANAGEPAVTVKTVELVFDKEKQVMEEEELQVKKAEEDPPTDKGEPSIEEDKPMVEKEVGEKEDAVSEKPTGQIVVNEELAAKNVDEPKPVVEQVEQLAVKKEEPTVEKKEPAVEKEEPTVEKEEPVVEKEELVVEKEEPTAEKEELVVEKEEPTAEKEEPVVEKEEPAVEKEELVVEKEELVVEKEEPTPEKEEPAVEKEGLAIEDEPPVATKVEPTANTTEDVVMEKKDELVTAEETKDELVFESSRGALSGENKGSTLPETSPVSSELDERPKTPAVASADG